MNILFNSLVVKYIFSQKLNLMRKTTLTRNEMSLHAKIIYTKTLKIRLTNELAYENLSIVIEVFFESVV